MPVKIVGDGAPITALVGQPSPILGVRVSDAHGNPVPDHPVFFEIMGRAATFPDGSRGIHVRTGNDPATQTLGLARAQIVASRPGLLYVRADAGAHGEVQIPVDPHDPPVHAAGDGTIDIELPRELLGNGGRRGSMQWPAALLGIALVTASIIGLLGWKLLDGKSGTSPSPQPVVVHVPGGGGSTAATDRLARRQSKEALKGVADLDTRVKKTFEEVRASVKERAPYSYVDTAVDTRAHPLERRADRVEHVVAAHVKETDRGAYDWLCAKEARDGIHKPICNLWRRTHVRSRRDRDS